MRKKLLVNNYGKILLSCCFCIVLFSITTIYPLSKSVTIKNKINESIVGVESPFGYGSGIIVGKEKQDDLNIYYVLTAYHLLNVGLGISSSEEAKFIVTSYNENEEITGINPASFFAGDATIDSMIITFVSSRDFVVAKISTSYNKMDDVYSCTCQLAEYPSVTKGIISRLSGKFIISDAEISPGSSGGGLFIKQDEQYFLIGVANQVAYRDGVLFTHCSYFISSRSFIKFLNFNKVPSIIQ